VIDFRSDNTHGASPEILEAVARAAAGTATSYGLDPITERVRERCREIFETDLQVFPVITGTAANALAIGTLTPAYGAVFCHAHAHILLEENGAAEFFSGGAKLIPVPGAGGKYTPNALISAIRDAALIDPNLPATVSVTNTTEAGTVYTVDQLETIGRVARSEMLGMHMDGARFANAVVATGASPADLTWRAGIDLLALGATKNGALAADLLVVFRPGLFLNSVNSRWHRGGHRPSKTRFLSAQLDAYLTDDLWLRNARHANAAARRLAEGVQGIEGVSVIHPVEANVVFLRLTAAVVSRLHYGKILFFDWPLFGDDAYRFVTAFDTQDEEIDQFLAVARGDA
jgi:threonine aldolase